MKLSFTVVHGQCTDDMLHELKCQQGYEKIKAIFDPVALLRLTGFLLWRQFWGSFFTGAYLPQKSVLSPPIESQYKPFQKHVSSY
jgi:hypothetical protein